MKLIYLHMKIQLFWEWAPSKLVCRYHRFRGAYNLILFRVAHYCHDLNPLNAELNPVCCLLALLGAHHFLHVSRIRVKSLTLRLLMLYMYICIYIYIYGAPILDVPRSHNGAPQSVGLLWMSDQLVTETSTWACGRSPAEILGSNPIGGMDICLLWVSCVVR